MVYIALRKILLPDKSIQNRPEAFKVQFYRNVCPADSWIAFNSLHPCIAFQERFHRNLPRIWRNEPRPDRKKSGLNNFNYVHIRLGLFPRICWWNLPLIVHVDNHLLVWQIVLFQEVDRLEAINQQQKKWQIINQPKLFYPTTSRVKTWNYDTPFKQQTN